MILFLQITVPFSRLRISRILWKGIMVSSESSFSVKYDFPSLMICEAETCFMSSGAPRCRYVIWYDSGFSLGAQRSLLRMFFTGWTIVGRWCVTGF